MSPLGKPQLLKLMSEVEQYLDDEWEVVGIFPDSVNAHVELKHDDRRSIHVVADQYRERGKLSLIGTAPRDSKGHAHRFSKGAVIGVSYSRKPQTIAKEITRRLLPAYNEQWVEVCAQIERMEQRQRTESQHLQNLAAAVSHATIQKHSSRTTTHHRNEIVVSFAPSSAWRSPKAIASVDYEHQGEPRTITLSFQYIPAAAAEAILKAYQAAIY